MSTPATPAANPEPAKDAGPEEIQKDIERTREELGETVEALAAKLDVKAQAKHKSEAAKARAASAASVARKRVSDAAAAASGRFAQISRRASAHVPQDEGQRKQLVLAASGVAGAVAGALIWCAYTRSSRTGSARGPEPYLRHGHQLRTGKPRRAGSGTTARRHPRPRAESRA